MIYAPNYSKEYLYVLGDLILQCIEPHAPLKHITLTRPPAPRLKIYKMRQIKQLRGKLWFETHETKAQEIWQKLHDVPNLPKEK